MLGSIKLNGVFQTKITKKPRPVVLPRIKNAGNL